MNVNNHSAENLLGRFGLLAIAPAVLLEAAIVVVVLSLPVTMGLAVGLGTVGVLALGSVVTAKPQDRRIFAGPAGTPVEMVEKLPLEGWTHHPAEGRPTVAATVTRVYGACPLGLMPGNTWEIGPGGALSRPMCRAAATALTALFEMGSGEVVGRKTCCECPFKEREVTFAVRETA